MKNFIVALLMLFFLIGCGGGSYDSGKKIVGGTEIANFSAKDVAKETGKYQFNNIDFFGYKAYKIPYTTRDEQGKKIQATGVMVIPTALGASVKKKDELENIQANGFAMVVNCHGTIFANSEAPSVYIANSKKPTGLPTLFSAYGGFILLMPDYIGFGGSKNHYHPYLMKKSSANAVKDFIAAAVDFANKNMIELAPNRDIFLTGYSQGGYVALASLSKIENSFSYNIDLAAPMDGPYLLEPFGKAITKAKTFKVPSFVADVCYSYAKTYGKKITSLIKEPYASRLSKLFNGNYTREQIDSQLTTKMRGEGGLLSDEIIEDYDTSWFRLKLAQNTAPKLISSYLTPIKLIHCKGDDVVPYDMAEATLKILKTAGSKADLITIENEINSKPLSHIKCAEPAYIYTAKMFIKKRKEVLGY